MAPITKTDITRFSTLSKSDLRDLTFGVYQIKQTKCYTEERMKYGQYIIIVQQNIMSGLGITISKS